MNFPSSPMLPIPMKKPYYRPLRFPIPTPTSLSGKVLNYILKMRSSLEQSYPPDESYINGLQGYFRALSTMECRLGRIPIASLGWYDAFTSNMMPMPSYRWVEVEKAVVVFNTGAAHSQIGATQNRGTEHGRKVAYWEFQKAANVFRSIKENPIVGLTFDLTAECATVLEKLMLAQALECLNDKVIADLNKKGLPTRKEPVFRSKISQQVGNFYYEAYTSLTSSLLHQHFERTWVSHIQLKSAYFHAEAVQLYCTDLHKKKEIGEEIARLKLASGKLSGAIKSSNDSGSILLAALHKLKTSINEILKKIVKENNKVFLMPVPPIDSLSELPGVVLANFPLVESPNLSGDPNLITDNLEIYLANYSDMVDSLIGVQTDKIQEAKNRNSARMRRLGLPDSISFVENGLNCPIELVTTVKEMQERGILCCLENESNKLKDLMTLNFELLDEIVEIVREAEIKDLKYRGEHNEPNEIYIPPISDYYANIMKAGINIEQCLKENRTLLDILNNTPVESVLQIFARPFTQDKTISDLKLSLSKMEIIDALFENLLKELKETKSKDDILPKLIATSLPVDHFFKKEIKKYDPICEKIISTIRSQKQLFFQIQTQNHEFTTLYGVEEHKGAHERSVKQILAAVGKFLEIEEKIRQSINNQMFTRHSLIVSKELVSASVTIRNIKRGQMPNTPKPSQERLSEIGPKNLTNTMAPRRKTEYKHKMRRA